MNWNGWQDTLECLQSLRRLDYPNYLTIVVDNGSWNESVERIRAWAHELLAGQAAFAEYSRREALAGGDPNLESLLDCVASPNRLVLIRNEENLGFTGGNNVSIHYALRRQMPVEYTFLLNNDASVQAGCVTALVAAARESGAGVVGALMLDDSGQHPIFNGRIAMIGQFFYPIVNWHLPPPAGQAQFWDSDCVHGGAKMIRSDVLEHVYSRFGEYLRGELFMYMEGAEFHHCAALLGYRSVVAGNALVYHKNARSSGGTENPLAYYYTERNRILVGRVVLPLWWRCLFLLVNIPLGFLRILKNLVRRRNRAALAILMGLFDGYRGVGGKWKFHDREAHRLSPSTSRNAQRECAGGRNYLLYRRINDIIPRLTRNPLLVELARRLRVAGLLKSWEYRLRGPGDGVFRHAIAGVEVLFAAPDATEFRTFECCYTGEMDFVEALANHLRQGGVFYDIGSNAGQFLIPMAKIIGERGQAVGFEPHPANHQRLMGNVALNGLTNVKVFQVALGDRNGEIHIYGTRGTATVVPRAAGRNGSLPVATVQAMRGDDLRTDAGLAIPTAVKIDVEGAEFGVLGGLKDTLSSPICELLCLEVHPDLLPAEVTIEMVFSLVRCFGFNHAETRPRAGAIHLIAEKVPRRS